MSSPKPLRKLHKPPTLATLHTPHTRPRKRLQKSHSAPTCALLRQDMRVRGQREWQGKGQEEQSIFLLEYEDYVGSSTPPLASQPSQPSPPPPPPPPSSFRKPAILGAYSTLNRATTGALTHGAYAFSKEGVLDGSEYLTATGRIKLTSHQVQTQGPTAPFPDPSALQKISTSIVRLDIPHPGAAPADSNPSATQRGQRPAGENPRQIFLALHETPQRLFCIAVFTSLGLAWAACLKDKAWLACSDELEDERRGVGEGNCPEVWVRVKGARGRQRWYVKCMEVDVDLVRSEGEGEGAGGLRGVRDVVAVLEGVRVDGGGFGVARKRVGGGGAWEGGGDGVRVTG
ncbi:predicted protein [Plenodomus lingam JN3]|uniref:Uncharacterized protein n=1 Tax=Leptosphaeria maculans (strain JN3 / isolate v23.1.3 / race Av1-4-5-6-7-8) TaxID=985895 RepID=E5A7G0_LEPMJ|nr:predicted protein [Plenodomus lingam JN3]CBX99555.1 predicted protein [Plenodomus lingam JN3]